MSLVKLTFPAGRTQFHNTGRSYTNQPGLGADANGQVVVDSDAVDIRDLLASGFTYAPLAGPTVQRPAGAAPGVQYFDTDLARPVWATGSGWVDATGQSA